MTTRAGRTAADDAVRAARDDRIFEMFQEGKSAKEISKCFGMDKSTCSYIIRTRRAMIEDDENPGEAEDRSPCPPRPMWFGAVRAPKLRIPSLEPGKMYVLPGSSAKTRYGNERVPARHMRFEGFIQGVGCRHAVFVHPVAGYRETFRDIDLQKLGVCVD